MSKRETITTRKPIEKLTAGDLKVFAVWEFTINEEQTAGQDETWVRPVNCARIRQGLYSQIVACDFVASGGRKLQGFMTVSTADHKVEIQPGAIVGKFGYRSIPSVTRKLAKARKYDWSLRERERLLTSLRSQENEVFPLTYTLRVLIGREIEFRSGLIR
jgi:hypothetical protein